MEGASHLARTRVLLPGPSSYLGRRLLLRLLDHPGVALRVLATSRMALGEAGARVADLIEGDPTDPEVLRRATAGIDVAFYPIGFVAADRAFEELNRTYPTRFRDACIGAGVQRIIFLGSYPRTDASDDDMTSPASAGRTLNAQPDRIQTIWFQSGFILGPGSLLFEALRHLVQKLPVLPAPRWMEAPAIAIGVQDVLDFLTSAIHVPLDRSVEVEIGLEPLRFRDMLTTTAAAMGVRRTVVRVPIRARKLSPYVLMLLSPFSTRLSRRFLEAMEVQGKASGQFSTTTARRLFPQLTPAPFEMAVTRTVAALEQEQVVSRWTDSMGVEFRSNVEAELARSVYRVVRRESFGTIPPERIFRAFSSIGGRQGWFRFTLLWRMRGVMDKLAGGFGDAAGRRDEAELRVGDVLDVWRVIDCTPARRLLLAAHMKTGGKAWLEFRIDGNTLTQTAYYSPNGLMGRLYWYSMLPFHAFIFPDMIRGIIRRAAREVVR